MNRSSLELRFFISPNNIADSSRANYTGRSMKIENLHVRAELSQSLHKLIGDSEDIFLSFAHEYPKLLKEAEESLSATKHILACFQDSTLPGCVDTDQGSGDENLVATLEESKTIIHQTIQSLTVMEENDARLFSELEQGIQSLSGLDDKIAHIKEDSIEMEIISLNAMTVALKAGNSGRAFSYITEELKRLSTRIIELTEEVTENGSVITSRFSDLQSAMGKLQSFQKEIFDTVNTTLMAHFEALNQGLTNTIQHLSQLNSEAQEVKKPLSKIMELTQTQDIIRQSLEHVIISVEELQQIEGLDSPEDLLDEMTFFTLMPQLCNAVLEEVESQIKTSKTSIRNHILEAESLIQKLDRNRDLVVHTFLEGEGQADLNSLHRKTAQSLVSMTWKLQEIITRKHSLGSFTLALLKEIQSLHRSFTQFNTLITRFKTIDIASRIEIAKNEILSQMISTVDEMTELTLRISSHVDTSFTLTSDFLRSSKDTIFQVRDQFATEETLVRKQEKLLNKKLKELETGKNNLGQLIQNYSVFSGGFRNLFTTSNNKFDHLAGLLTQISHIRTLLNNIQEEAESARDELLKQENLETWTLRSHKLQQIIQRFTIFSHKKVAGSLAGFEVEDGVASGEVTLF